MSSALKSLARTVLLAALVGFVVAATMDALDRDGDVAAIAAVIAVVVLDRKVQSQRGSA